MKTTKIEIRVQTYSRPNRYLGVEDGKTQWVCEPVPPFTPFSAVLGRSTISRDDAVADFLRRAACESYAKQYEINLTIVNISTPRVPVCDVAKSMHDFKQRLVHYRTCSDPRCQARAAAATDLGSKLAKELKGGK